jgi:predicted P-loop ATPase
MYWPSCSIDAEPVYYWNHGTAVKVDDLLRCYGEGDAWKDTRLWPIAQSEQEIHVREARRQGDPREKPGIIGQFCRAYGIEDAIDKFLSDVYVKCDGPGLPRYTYLNGSGSAGLVVYDGGLFAYSNHATDPIGGLEVNAFDLVRIHLFGAKDEGQENQDVTRRPSYKAMCELAASDSLVLRMIVEEQEETVADLVSGSPDKDSANWTDELVLNSKTGKPEQTIDNTVLLLRNFPGLSGLVGYNRLQHHMYQLHAAPWDGEEAVPFTPRAWTDVEDAQVYRYLEKKFGLNNRANTDSALRIVADENAYHPVQDYLRGLEWDGVERLDSMVIDYLGALDTPLTRVTTRKHMVAAVARIMHPGVKYEYALTLSGPEGIGKTTLIKRLGMRWYSNSFSSGDVGDKASMEQVQGQWLIELGELVAVRKNTNEAFKNFITTDVDKFRPAYARKAVELPRQCVFWATTNETYFLKGDTGNRRFWTIYVGGDLVSKDVFSMTQEDIDQLWAEAVVRYRQGEQLFLDPALNREAIRQAEEANEIAGDERAGVIEAFIRRPVPKDWRQKTRNERAGWFRIGHNSEFQDGEACRRAYICSQEVANECFQKDMNRYEMREINQILFRMPGLKKPAGTSRIGDKAYGVQRWYEITPEFWSVTDDENAFVTESNKPDLLRSDA